MAGKVFIVGGSGFIGSHFVDFLLDDQDIEKVTVFDNMSSGRKWHIAQHLADPRFRLETGDADDLNALAKSMESHEVVIHLASNPDIARAAVDPTIDFRQGTVLTQNVVEAMRLVNAERIIYTSGSGVYGDIGDLEVKEDFGPLIPISTYGASKLAGETLISSYCHMFESKGVAFRLANVVGPRQTHGVGFDFLRKLAQSPDRLDILGDGTQSKSYIHVRDAIEGMWLAHESNNRPFDVFNLGTGDYITVTEIADLAVECFGLAQGEVDYVYSGGDRGWKGDVPVIRLNTKKIGSLGWKCSRTSGEALREAMDAMLEEISAGRI